MATTVQLRDTSAGRNHSARRCRVSDRSVLPSGRVEQCGARQSFHVAKVENDVDVLVETRLRAKHDQTLGVKERGLSVGNGGGLRQRCAIDIGIVRKLRNEGGEGTAAIYLVGGEAQATRDGQIGTRRSEREQSRGQLVLANGIG